MMNLLSYKVIYFRPNISRKFKMGAIKNVLDCSDYCDIQERNIGLSYLLSYVYSKQPIFWQTQEWFRALSFSRLECGVHDRLHISSADW